MVVIYNMKFKKKTISNWIGFLVYTFMVISTLYSFVINSLPNINTILLIISSVIWGIWLYLLITEKIEINNNHLIIPAAILYNFKEKKINYEDINKISVEEDVIELKTNNKKYEINIASFRNKKLINKKLQEVKSKYSI